MNGITIATFNLAAQAEPLREKLEQAGIHAEVHDESVMGRLWFVSKTLASVRVKVASEDYERAKSSLEVWDKESGVMREAVRCPECGSSRIEYPQHTRKFILPNLIGVLSGLGMVEKEFYCDDCQFTWPRTGLKPSRARSNQAPYYFIEGVLQTDHPESATVASLRENAPLDDHQHQGAE